MEKPNISGVGTSPSNLQASVKAKLRIACKGLDSLLDVPPGVRTIMSSKMKHSNYPGFNI
jgi:hypothetical protein